ncbi:MAG: hypothetical protein IJ326_04040 [Lachnospiraceae bacterium]|nr:hypothetical protein [Lachnospiraceae bacterium]
MNHKITAFILACIFALGLTGCGYKTDEERALATFSSSISSFTNTVLSIDMQMNELDVTDENACADLLTMLDNLDKEFQTLAELSVPEQYLSIEPLADEASENMSIAVSYFHSAYESEAFNATDADVAHQYYERAMTRIEYIGYILTGEIPEDENVIIHEETSDDRIIDKFINK